MLTVAAAISVGFVSKILGYSPASRWAHYTFNQREPNAIPDINNLIEQRWRKEITEDKYYAEMKMQGFNKDMAARFYWTAKQLLTGADLVSLKRRGLITSEDYKRQMSENKYTPTQTNRIERLTEFIPQVGDIIRFAVRESYRDDVAALYGYDEGLEQVPTREQIEALNMETRDKLQGMARLASDGLKVGMSPKTLKSYWRSHWQLPSPQLGFQMFHRLQQSDNVETRTTKEDLSTLLKIADFPEYWRNRMMAVSYNLPTRVDIRRMYKLGQLDSKEVAAVYQQLGYNPKWADKLTQLAVSDAIGDVRDKMVLDLAISLHHGEIDVNEAMNEVIELGYTAEVAALKLQSELYKIESEFLGLQIEKLKTQYLEGSINIDEMVGSLDKLGISGAQRDAEVLDAQIKKEKRTRLPTVEDLERWASKGIIDSITLIDKLEDIGYKEDDINRYLQDWGVSA